MTITIYARPFNEDWIDIPSELDQYMMDNYYNLTCVSKQYSNTTPVGEIISITPRTSGAFPLILSPKRGSTFGAAVSMGVDPGDGVLVPDLRNKTVAEAYELLLNAGLFLGNTTKVREFGTFTYGLGKIVQSSPRHNTYVPPNTCINISLIADSTESGGVDVANNPVGKTYYPASVWWTPVYAQLWRAMNSKREFLDKVPPFQLFLEQVGGSPNYTPHGVTDVRDMTVRAQNNYAQEIAIFLHICWIFLVEELSVSITDGVGERVYWGIPGTEAHPRRLTIDPEFRALGGKDGAFGFSSYHFGNLSARLRTIRVMRRQLDKMQFKFKVVAPTQLETSEYYEYYSRPDSPSHIGTVPGIEVETLVHNPQCLETEFGMDKTSIGGLTWRYGGNRPLYYWDRRVYPWLKGDEICPVKYGEVWSDGTIPSSVPMTTTRIRYNMDQLKSIIQYKAEATPRLGLYGEMVSAGLFVPDPSTQPEWIVGYYWGGATWEARSGYIIGYTGDFYGDGGTFDASGTVAAYTNTQGPFQKDVNFAFQGYNPVSDRFEQRTYHSTGYLVGEITSYAVKERPIFGFEFDTPFPGTVDVTIGAYDAVNDRTHIEVDATFSGISVFHPTTPRTWNAVDEGVSSSFAVWKSQSYNTVLTGYKSLFEGGTPTYAVVWDQPVLHSNLTYTFSFFWYDTWSSSRNTWYVQFS